MKGESVFRGIAATLLAAALSVSAYYRHRAEQASEEKISWREEGLPTIIALRSFGLALLLSMMTYMLNPRWMEWSSLSLPAWLRWSGAGLGAATLPLTYWVFRSLGRT